MAAIDRAISVPGRVIAVGGARCCRPRTAPPSSRPGCWSTCGPPETLAGRLTGVIDRPLLGNTADRAGRIRDLLVARGPIYETAGDVAIDTDRLNVEQVAVEVMEWYRRRVGAMAGR